MDKKTAAPERRKKRHAFLNRDTWRRFKKNKASVVGLLQEVHPKFLSLY